LWQDTRTPRDHHLQRSRLQVYRRTVTWK
jgi:hypothetical protein